MTELSAAQFDQSTSLLLYGYENEPVCCPWCGKRTYFQELCGSDLGIPAEVGLQLHRCCSSYCHYVFLAFESVSL